MKSYISSNGLRAIAGNDYADKNLFDWAWITTNVNNGNAMVILVPIVEYNPNIKTGNHFMLIVGYQAYTSTDYLRVADGFDHSLSHFFNYKYTNVITIWYCRW